MHNEGAEITTSKIQHQRKRNNKRNQVTKAKSIVLQIWTVRHTFVTIVFKAIDSRNICEHFVVASFHYVYWILDVCLWHIPFRRALVYTYGRLGSLIMKNKNAHNRIFQTLKFSEEADCKAHHVRKQNKHQTWKTCKKANYSNNNSNNWVESITKVTYYC